MKIGLWIFTVFLVLARWPCHAETLVVFGDENYAPIIHLREGRPGFCLQCLPALRP